ncbi:MAG: redoxin domain-containing protein [Acidobacteriota bacterium]|nr:redoxin domain-containing protein [Blastocatellia bacterium]MDW8239901.1 redoxin domain-containing protein [Acidobacteriota bacterium]
MCESSFSSIIVRFSHCLVLLVIVCSMPLAGRAQSSQYGCAPSPKVKAALDKLPHDDDERIPSQEIQEQRFRQLRELLKKYPDDLFVHREYQDALSHEEDLPRLIAEYQARMEKRPNDPTALYLYGRLLSRRNPEEALPVAEKALKQSPLFPWTHLLLTSIYFSLDRNKARTHLAEFMKLCPDAMEAYRYASLITDQQQLRELTARLRARIQGKKDIESVTAYEQLWELEFRARPVPEHAALRQQVAEDVKRLRALNLTSERQWFWTLYQGYKYVNDTEGQNWVEEQMRRLYPYYSTTRWMIDERWRAKHPYPERNATPEEKQAYFQALLQHAEQKLRLLPESVAGWLDHFDAVTNLQGSTDADVLAAADGLLNALKKDPKRFLSTPPFSIRVASQYVKRNLRIEQVPLLIQEGINEVEQRAARASHSKQLRKIEEHNLKYTRWVAWPLLVDAYLRLNQHEKAREVLAQMNAALVEEKPDEKAKPGEHRLYAQRQATVWKWTGRLAEAENRKLDAIAFYQHALRTHPKEWPLDDEGSDKLPEKVRRMWTELGGTQDGWAAWNAMLAADRSVAEATEVTNWEKQDKVLPDFELSDLQGKPWRLADLKGKVAFINVWATWCGPCRKELPHVQKLHEQMKDRQDVLVLTFNVDTAIGLVEPFVKKNGYTFTVIPAQAYVQDLVPVLAIPRNWIIGPDGILRLEQVGFGGDGDKWIAQVIEAIAKVQSGQDK